MNTAQRREIERLSTWTCHWCGRTAVSEDAMPMQWWRVVQRAGPPQNSVWLCSLQCLEHCVYRFFLYMQEGAAQEGANQMRPTSAVVLQQVMDDIDAAGIERLLRLARTQAVEPADILPLYIAALHQARRERDEEREKREKAQRKLDGAHEEILRLTRQCADLSRQVAHLTEMQTRAWSDKG